MTFFYVYILQSEAVPEAFYVGFAEDLRIRCALESGNEPSHLEPVELSANIAGIRVGGQTNPAASNSPLCNRRLLL
jgi:hypothetical protein